MATKVAQIRPRSVLDLGAGDGLFGTLCRRYLDIAAERYTPSSWQTNIVGVEGFGQYVTAVHHWAYNKVLVEDFSKEANWPGYTGYGLVLMLDSLEHLPKDVGAKLLAHLVYNNANVVVSTPSYWTEQGAVMGNELERHRALWTEDDYRWSGGEVFHRGECLLVHYNRKKLLGRGF